jgi:hypothetical protein
MIPTGNDLNSGQSAAIQINRKGKIHDLERHSIG